MTEAEKRRKELLDQTRLLYHDRNVVPAIHPRYGATYAKLYGREKNEKSEGVASSLGARLFLSLLLFVLYASANYNNLALMNYQCEDVIEVISQNIILEEIEQEDIEVDDETDQEGAQQLEEKELENIELENAIDS